MPTLLLAWTLAALRVSAACAGAVDHATGEDVAREIWAVGLPAEATGPAIWETGGRVDDNPVVGFRLEVHAEGREPWEAGTGAPVSILSIPRIQPGEVLPVVYDPAHPRRVALDLVGCGRPGGWQVRRRCESRRVGLESPCPACRPHRVPGREGQP
jgi:hypothetical protein